MKRQRKEVIGFAKPVHGAADQRAGGDVESHPRFVGDQAQRFRFPLFRRQPAEVEQRKIDREHRHYSLDGLLILEQESSSATPHDGG